MHARLSARTAACVDRVVLSSQYISIHCNSSCHHDDHQVTAPNFNRDGHHTTYLPDPKVYQHLTSVLLRLIPNTPSAQDRWLLWLNLVKKFGPQPQEEIRVWMWRVLTSMAVAVSMCTKDLDSEAPQDWSTRLWRGLTTNTSALGSRASRRFPVKMRNTGLFIPSGLQLWKTNL